MPVILVLCTIGSYADNAALFDVWVMLGAGVFGYVMRKYGYEPAPLVVGLVLGCVMERSLLQTMIISQGKISGLWESTLGLIMWVMVVLALITPAFLRVYKLKKIK